MNYKKGNANIGVILAFIIVVGIISFGIYTLTRDNSEPKEVASINSSLNTENSNGNKETLKDNNLEEKKSMEKISKNGDVLSMNYTGKLIDGTIFDSNVLPQFGHVEPFEFTLGAGQVIKGWDEGLVGMKIGEKKTLTIPPEKGYGNRAIGKIPANSTLIFDVELLGIK
jgi:FKBP-type peptidyl-prolyl cis-trans isomerase